MIDFIIGFILGGFIGIMLISIVIVGNEKQRMAGRNGMKY